MLDAQVGGSTDADDCSFVVRGVELVAAEWRDGQLSDGGAMRSALPDIRFTWRERRAGESDEADDVGAGVTLPLYLNETRRNMLIRVPLPVASGVDATRWFECGTALLASRFD